MTIYVEYIIIDNIVINTLILLLTKTILKHNTSKKRILFGALLGTVVSLFSPLLPAVICNIIKIPLGLCMILVAFKSKNVKNLMISFAVFTICTFVFGGACFGIMQVLGIEVIINNGISYTYKFPVGAVLLVCFVTYVAIKNIVLYLYQKKKQHEFYYDTTLCENNKKISVTAFLDTGNKLVVDEKSVSIINYKTFNMLYPKISLADILLKKSLSLKNEKYIEIQSIDGNKNSILTFEIDGLYIDKRQIKNAKLGLSLTSFNKKLNSDMIISQKLLGEFYDKFETN
ncbi:MAG: sigma-E processing peptidase SpoIIGA [Clostridia bacterium]|nr:sigma-E processing peptidase SpoIIGA [Clostridia bacterium]